VKHLVLSSLVLALACAPASAGGWKTRALAEHTFNCRLAATLRVENCLDSELSARSCFEVARLQYDECVKPYASVSSYTEYRRVARYYRRYSAASLTCVDQQARDLRWLWGKGCCGG
jgi:hypothetical protein